MTHGYSNPVYIKAFLSFLNIYGLANHGFNTDLSRDRQVTAGSQESKYSSAKQRFKIDLNGNSQVTAGIKGFRLGLAKHRLDKDLSQIS